MTNIGATWIHIPCNRQMNKDWNAKQLASWFGTQHKTTSQIWPLSRVIQINADNVKDFKTSRCPSHVAVHDSYASTHIIYPHFEKLNTQADNRYVQICCTSKELHSGSIHCFSHMVWVLQNNRRWDAHLGWMWVRNMVHTTTKVAHTFHYGMQHVIIRVGRMWPDEHTHVSMRMGVGLSEPIEKAWGETWELVR